MLDQNTIQAIAAAVSASIVTTLSTQFGESKPKQAAKPSSSPANRGKIPAKATKIVPVKAVKQVPNDEDFDGFDAIADKDARVRLPKAAFNAAGKVRVNGETFNAQSDGRGRLSVGFIGAEHGDTVRFERIQRGSYDAYVFDETKPAAKVPAKSVKPPVVSKVPAIRKVSVKSASPAPSVKVPQRVKSAGVKSRLAGNGANLIVKVAQTARKASKPVLKSETFDVIFAETNETASQNYNKPNFVGNEKYPENDIRFYLTHEQRKTFAARIARSRGSWIARDEFVAICVSAFDTWVAE